MDPFSGVSPENRLCIEANKKSFDFKRGEYIYRQSEKPRGLFFLRSGLVGLTSISSEGNEHLLRLFRPGQFFGHRSYFSEEPYHASGICLEPAKIDFVPAVCIETVLKNQPELLYNVVKMLAVELRRSEESRISISDKDVTTRTAEALVYLQNIYPDHNWTRKEIAEFLDSTAPTVVRSLQKLESLGLIRQSGRKIEVLDYSALLQL